MSGDDVSLKVILHMAFLCKLRYVDSLSFMAGSWLNVELASGCAMVAPTRYLVVHGLCDGDLIGK